MRSLLQLCSIVFIIWTFIAGLFFLALPSTILYMFFFRGFELIVVAVLIDGYFQAFYTFPWLSVCMVGAVFLIDFIKPQLLMYTGHNEMVS